MPKVTDDYKEKRRREILDVAEKVFCEKGFGSTTMTDIVNETEFSRGGVYKYFSSTDEMFQAIMDDRDKKFSTYFNQLASDYETIWQALCYYLDEFEGNLKSLKSEFGIVQSEYFIMSSRYKERGPFLQLRVDRNMKVLEDFLQIGVDTGEFKPIQPLEAIVLFLSNITDGLYLNTHMVGYERAHIVEQFEGLKMYLTQALGVAKN
ncbi:TetR family transcriptional regulator [Cytobacillus sp. IB215665]|uniref:TetR family transcriptional regulator n=1 Tax=Cytobacillus sp. IB215665 TaxID=3097357 RepID=UPI002A138B07|nr:TetR family transcriptional regulator [Cytobacillus sp. IB215665]MDX8363779.1 TetR family transcriptional regulator [Cytobacillus sp. IB215665]